MNKRVMNVDILARVEGEGALDLEIENNKISKLALRIYEPPRYFEKFVEGRKDNDVIDIVARICGICPIAYQMSAGYAMEQAYGIQTTPWIRELRRLIYCGEWIQSHALHVHLLAAPDFLKYQSALEMAKDFPNEVVRGMKLQELGHDIMELLIGRSVNPVGNCVGGVYRAPTEKEIKALGDKLKAHQQDAYDMVRWIGSIETPHFPQEDIIYVALRHADEYPLSEGRLVNNKGLDIDIKDYEKHFTEFHVEHSTSLHSTVDGKPYVVGPLARVVLNYDKLPKHIQDLAAEINLTPDSKSMFDCIKARAIEILYAIEESIRICDNYKYSDTPHVEVKSGKNAEGYGCTEAPRGICWHHYTMSEDRTVKFAKIVPPTSQNQAYIEKDLADTYAQYGLDHTDDELRLMGEMVIRNYDPCISCSVHFLNLNIKRHD